MLGKDAQEIFAAPVLKFATFCFGPPDYGSGERKDSQQRTVEIQISGCSSDAICFTAGVQRLLMNLCGDPSRVQVNFVGHAQAR